MKRIDQLLGRQLFRVDAMACSEAAAVIRDYKANIEHTPWGKLPVRVQLTFKIAFVSICHQFNWDFLQNRLADRLLGGGKADLVDSISDIDARTIEMWLGDYHRSDRIRASERAALLRDVGRKLRDKLHGDAMQLYESSKRHVSGDSGFIAQLDLFDAFRADPLRKKSYVLVHDLVRERILSFDDDNKIEPAIDYHIMRLYLRTGRVVPTSVEAMEELKGKPRPRPRFVTLLREAVSEATKLTAFYAHLSVPDVNYIEWQIARTICTNEHPNCQREEHALQLDPDIKVLFEGLCPYIQFCEAYFNKEWRSLREPVFKKSFY